MSHEHLKKHLEDSFHRYLVKNMTPELKKTIGSQTLTEIIRLGARWCYGTKYTHTIYAEDEGPEAKGDFIAELKKI